MYTVQYSTYRCLYLIQKVLARVGGKVSVPDTEGLGQGGREGVSVPDTEGLGQGGRVGVCT